MLLITVNEWLGSRYRNDLETKNSLKAFATRLPLEESLTALAEYQDAYNRNHVSIAVNFTLISVCTIDELSDATLERMQVQRIEKLPSYGQICQQLTNALTQAFSERNHD